MTSSESTSADEIRPTERFVTSDGCELRYRDIGTGEPIILLHGSFQSGAFFRRQYTDETLTAEHRFIVPDLRGHGASSAPAYGYRLSRLAKDVRELVIDLDLDGATWLGWSMGCMVIWSYWDLFGGDRIDRLVLVDCPPWMLNHDGYDLGLVPPDAALDMVSRFRHEQDAIAADLVDMLTVGALPDEERDWMIEENLKIPAEQAAELAFQVFFVDWRDVIPRIDVPTLVVGGTESHLDWEAQAWIADQLPNGDLEVFDGQAHLLFYEAADRFNDLLSAHCRASGTRSG